jgi:hypothetical protein
LAACAHPDLDGAITEVMEQRGPEVGDATAVLNGFRRQLVDLADHLGAIGEACSSYAHDLDRPQRPSRRRWVQTRELAPAARAAQRAQRSREPFAAGAPFT